LTRRDLTDPWRRYLVSYAPSAAFVSDFCGAVVKRVNDFEPQHLSNTLNGLAKTSTQTGSARPPRRTIDALTR
jgi:hypothetical protein